MKKTILSFSFLIAFVFLFASKSFALETYSLPYPGILPDSPIYFLKVTRDKATTIFIQNSTDRAFYLLFLADKRLAAARLLDQQNKKDLAAVTYMSAEDYFAQAVSEAEKSNDKDRLMDLIAKLTASSAEHRNLTTSYQEAYQLSLRNYDRVLALLEKYFV